MHYASKNKNLKKNHLKPVPKSVRVEIQGSGDFIHNDFLRLHGHLQGQLQRFGRKISKTRSIFMKTY